MKAGTYRVRYGVYVQDQEGNYVRIDHSKRMKNKQKAEEQKVLAQQLEDQTRCFLYDMNDVVCWKAKGLLSHGDAERLMGAIKDDYQYGGAGSPCSEACANCDELRRLSLINQRLESEQSKLKQNHQIKLQEYSDRIVYLEGMLINAEEKIKKLKKVREININVKQRNSQSAIMSHVPKCLEDGLIKINPSLPTVVNSFPLGVLNIGPVVYFLLADNNVIRIGESINLTMRLYDHKRTLDFDRVLYVPAPKDREERMELETRTIRLFRPPENKSLH